MSIKGYTSVWEIMKQTADKDELKELQAIEDRYKKKPASLNNFGKKLMKQNPLDKLPGELIKNHELYDDPNPKVIKDLKKWEQSQSNEIDNSDPIVANGVITTEKQLKKQFIDQVKAVPAAFKKPNKVVSAASKKYAEDLAKATLEHVKKNYEQDKKNIAAAEPAAINARPTPIENQPQYRGTIFGSDVYYRRKVERLSIRRIL
tara:strand:- start:232 stop:843 length:612 start_codon:yes stop_codon:yes gene_type:complete